MPRRRRGSARAGLNADINVTSLVDVAFLLLIIFMIAAPMMQGGVDVRLPQAAARPLETREGLVVSVDRRGRIYIDQAPFAWADFRATFGAIVARRRPEAVYVRADRAADYGVVVRVLAVIRQSGIENVGLVTEEEEIIR
jgi:biopolymer transport protein TolR